MATITTSAGGVKAPRKRKSRFEEAAEREGANHVTIKTSAMLIESISAVRRVCERLRIMRQKDGNAMDFLFSIVQCSSFICHCLNRCARTGLRQMNNDKRTMNNGK